MIQKDIFRDKMAILDVCVNANMPPEKMEIFYQIISPRMTTEGFLSSFEKILTGQVKLFGAITTADIISACDEFKTMAEKSKSLIQKAKYRALNLYQETGTEEYENVIIALYGSRENFEQEKEENKAYYTEDYWRDVYKRQFIATAEKIETEKYFKEYGIEPIEIQGLLK